jgi:hypothetical protein
MQSDNITIETVDNEADKMRFIKFPWKIYKNDKNWVPPLIFDVKKNLDTKRNPFYKHSKIKLWLAWKDGALAGRIAGITNENHNKYYNDKVGFFGFFECINDKEVAKKLFEKAEEFVKQNGMDTLRGPVNPSMNDECGLLVDGFDTPPVMLMTYNPEYYIDLITSAGFEKAKDLYALDIKREVVNNTELMKKLDRISEMVLKREKITIRNLNMKDLDNEIQKVRDVYNNAWQDNWGFVPMTEEEFNFVADSLKAVVDPDFVEIAEVDGNPIGFSLAMPDMNQVFIKLNGKLFPFGLIKFILNKKKVNRLRVIIMGMKKEYHKKGIDAVFYRDVIKMGDKKNYNGAEISWVLEDNHAMINTAEKLGAEIYKTYRIYDKRVG